MKAMIAQPMKKSTIASTANSIAFMGVEVIVKHPGGDVPTFVKFFDVRLDVAQFSEVDTILVPDHTGQAVDEGVGVLRILDEHEVFLLVFESLRSSRLCQVDRKLPDPITNECDQDQVRELFVPCHDDLHVCCNGIRKNGEVSIVVQVYPAFVPCLRHDMIVMSHDRADEYPRSFLVMVECDPIAPALFDPDTSESGVSFT